MKSNLMLVWFLSWTLSSLYAQPGQHEGDVTTASYNIEFPSLDGNVLEEGESASLDISLPHGNPKADLPVINTKGKADWAIFELTGRVQVKKKGPFKPPTHPKSHAVTVRLSLNGDENYAEAGNVLLQSSGSRGVPTAWSNSEDTYVVAEYYSFKLKTKSKIGKGGKIYAILTAGTVRWGNPPTANITLTNLEGTVHLVSK